MTAHFIVCLLLVTSIIVPIILLANLFKGGMHAVDRVWDGLACWVDQALED